jgi:putative ABC transport system substrate-binding protein
VEAGGLMSYGVDVALMYQRAASYGAKILRGAQPADLPVDQADKFHFRTRYAHIEFFGS